MDTKRNQQAYKNVYEQKGEKEVFQPEISASQSGGEDYSMLAYFSKIQEENEETK